MYRRLFFTAVFCLCFTTISSIRCYVGTEQQCMLVSDVNDCGEGETCQCMKYLVRCTDDKEACTEHEQSIGATKETYGLVSKSTCDLYQMSVSVPSDVTCCSTDGCNAPEKGKCSQSRGHRRNLRKLIGLLDLNSNY